MRAALVRTPVVVTAIRIPLHGRRVALVQTTVRDLGLTRGFVSAMAFLVADGDRVILHRRVDARRVFGVTVFDDPLARSLRGRAGRILVVARAAYGRSADNQSAYKKPKNRQQLHN